MTMYANNEDFQILAITTMVSSFVAEWNDHTMQMRGGAKSRNLLYSVLNFELRNCSLDPQHPIADADVRLYVLLPAFPIFQLFAQSRGNRHRCRLTYTGRVTYYRTAAPGSKQADKRA